MSEQNEKILIDLGNGFSLYAEQNTDPEYSKEIFLGIRDWCGWIQDLAIVRPAYIYDNEFNVHWMNEVFEVLVYGNGDEEDYTERFAITLRSDLQEENNG